MPYHFSFSGCGFLGIYHLGVSACLKQHVPNLLEDCKIAGASAGSFVACCLITGCSIDECTSYVLRLVDQAESQPILGPLHPRFKLMSELHESMLQVLPEDAYKIATGRLFISLTRYKDLKNVIVSEYESNTELIDAMLCSGFIPFYCGIIPPRYKGDYYWDGGLSDNQPIFDEPTITVSPFSGETDICPLDNSSNFIHLNICNSSVQFTQENLHRVSIALFPPQSLTMSEIFQQGYNDTLRYLQKNGMINCIDHLNVIEVPNFQREDVHDGEMDKKEKPNKTSEEDDFDCRECKQKIRKTLFASLPPQLLKVFHSSKKQSILNHLCQGKLFQAMSMILKPFVAPADILLAYITSIIKNIPKSQQSLENILKQLYCLSLCFLHNFLYKPCRHSSHHPHHTPFFSPNADYSPQPSKLPEES